VQGPAHAGGPPLPPSFRPSGSRAREPPAASRSTATGSGVPVALGWHSFEGSRILVRRENADCCKTYVPYVGQRGPGPEVGAQETHEVYPEPGQHPAKMEKRFDTTWSPPLEVGPGTSRHCQRVEEQTGESISLSAWNAQRMEFLRMTAVATVPCTDDKLLNLGFVDEQRRLVVVGQEMGAEPAVRRFDEDRILRHRQP
jgi:hypothetical protein